MKKYTELLILALGMVSLAACQQVPLATNGTSNGGYPPSTDSGPTLELCADGSWDCYFEIDPGEDPLDEIPDDGLDQTYDECMLDCLAESSQCSDDLAATTDLDELEDRCSGDYGACAARCVLLSEESPLADYPACEAPIVPTNPYVFEVEIDLCATAEGTLNEIHFQGPTVSFITPVEGDKETVRQGGLDRDYITLGYPIGRNPYCPNPESDPADQYRNQVKVKFTPITTSPITIGATQVSNNPSFPDPLGELNQTFSYGSPHTIPFGLPKIIRDNASLDQISWVAHEKQDDPVPKTPTHPRIDGMRDFEFCYYDNNLAYGHSLVLFTDTSYRDPAGKDELPVAYTQKIRMYLLVKSLQ